MPKKNKDDINFWLQHLNTVRGEGNSILLDQSEKQNKKFYFCTVRGSFACIATQQETPKVTGKIVHEKKTATTTTI